MPWPPQRGGLGAPDAERAGASWEGERPWPGWLARPEVALIPWVPSRSRTRCRHFLLAQLGDGRHVVLGEDSAHVRLQDLLQHYTACPLSPYGEKLTEPLARQVPPAPGPRDPGHHLILPCDAAIGLLSTLCP